MWAASRGYSLINFKKQHYCCDHKVMVDRQHLFKCSHLSEFDDLKKPLQKLKHKNIREWAKLDIIVAVLRFTLFAAKVRELEDQGTFIIEDGIYLINLRCNNRD